MAEDEDRQSCGTLGRARGNNKDRCPKAFRNSRPLTPLPIHCYSSGCSCAACRIHSRIPRRLLTAEMGGAARRANLIHRAETVSTRRSTGDDASYTCRCPTRPRHACSVRVPVLCRPVERMKSVPSSLQQRRRSLCCSSAVRLALLRRDRSLAAAFLRARLR